MASTDVRAQAVLDRFIDLVSLSNYVLDRFTDMGGNAELQKGEKLRIPAMGNLTVETDGATRVDGASRQQASTSSIELTVDQEPWIPVQVPARDQIQSLQGRFMQEVATQAMIQLRNYMDGLILDDYLSAQVAWDTAGTYHYNEASDGLTAADILVARGIQLRNRASNLASQLLVMDPLAVAAVMGFSGWQQATTNTSYGADTVGRIFGMPVVETQGCRLQPSWIEGDTLVSGALTSNVITLVFSEATGLVPGQVISLTATDTGTYDGNYTVATVSSDGKTVTIPKTASNDADILSGTDDTVVVDESAHNLIVDRSHVYTAWQKMPMVRFVPDPETTGDIMQVSTLFGFLGRAGRVRTIHSPPASLT
jgi:hypothetical protein